MRTCVIEMSERISVIIYRKHFFLVNKLLAVETESENVMATESGSWPWGRGERELWLNSLNGTREGLLHWQDTKWTYILCLARRECGSNGAKRKWRKSPLSKTDTLSDFVNYVGLFVYFLFLLYNSIFILQNLYQLSYL